jgi:hypothetical protein
MKGSEVAGAFERSSHPLTETSSEFIHGTRADGVLTTIATFNTANERE